MLFRLKFLYYVRKPRILSQNDISLIEYRRSMRDARRNVHIEAQQYQNKIQDEYLERHKQQMNQRHLNNQCSFRKQVFTWSYRLYQNQKIWKQKDEMFNSRQNKYLHDEDIRKINRNRILKIMEHQSGNYWFNSDNVDEKLTDQTIFPEYIASTQYYYKLFGQSLAYETADLQRVHEISSSQETIRQKNKLLIPLFLELRTKILQYKENLSKNTINPATEAEKKVQLLKNNIKDLLVILKIWKQYTNVLGLTSAQIMKSKYDVENELSINKLQKNILKNIKNKQSELFIGSIQEDTEEVQISFEQYLKTLDKNLRQSEANLGGNMEIDELNDLIKQSKDESEGDIANDGTIKLNDLKGLALGNLISSETTKTSASSPSLQQVSQINPEFLNPRQTTSSIQILKIHFKDDQQFINLLNKIGQIDVRYADLFEKIWSQINI